ncbi:hypothetical protein PM082_000497 [Marasmius tenuissimus]|nr:hypothetical protein PM082_000497 [Marasmius tenuissimus]
MSQWPTILPSFPPTTTYPCTSLSAGHSTYPFAFLFVFLCHHHREYHSAVVFVASILPDLTTDFVICTC